MKKPTLALFLVLMTLLIIAPKLWAQELVCEEVNGLLWCYNNQACGQPCNEVCAVIGSQPIADNTVWFEAQNTEEKCQAISQAFGLGNNFLLLDSLNLGCLEDTTGDHTVNGGLNTPLLCTTRSICPSLHRTEMSRMGIPCEGTGSKRSICPCQQLPQPQPIPTLSEWGLLAMAGILGIVGFMVIRRKKATV